jgi:hypothetical protein
MPKAIMSAKLEASRDVFDRTAQGVMDGEETGNELRRLARTLVL